MLIDVSEQELDVLARIRAADTWGKIIYFDVLHVPLDDACTAAYAEHIKNRARREAEETLERMLRFFDERGKPVSITYKRDIMKNAERSAARQLREFTQRQRQYRQEIKQLKAAQQPLRRRSSGAQLQILRAQGDPGTGAADPAQLAQIPPEIQRGLD